MRKQVRAALQVFCLVAGPGASAVGSAYLAGPVVRDLRVHVGAGRALKAWPFELTVALMAVVVLTTCVLWLLLVVAATVLEAATGLSSRLVRAATPGLVRQAVLTSVAVALGGAATVAPAAASPQDGEPVGGQAAVGLGPASALAGLPLPDRATGTPSPAARPRTIAVARGDSLWSIAETLLPPGAGPDVVDDTWRELYRRNRAAVGPNPDHLEVGAVLRVPTSTGHEPPTRKDAP